MTLDKTSRQPLVGAPTLPSLDRPLSSLPIVQDAVRRVSNSLPNQLWPGSGMQGASDRTLTPAPTPATPSAKDATQSQLQTHQRTAASGSSLAHLPLSNHFHKQARKIQAMRASVTRHKLLAQRVASALQEDDTLSPSRVTAAVIGAPSPLRRHVERRPGTSTDHGHTRANGRHTKHSVYDASLWLPPFTAMPLAVADSMRRHASASETTHDISSESTGETSSQQQAHWQDRLDKISSLQTVVPLNAQDLLKSETVKVVEARSMPDNKWHPGSLTLHSTHRSMKQSVSVTKE